MLRPERMSRVSVTGARQVMDEVIETIHDLNLFHVTEYDGSWEGFDPGDPTEGADTASQKLVTVRSLKTTLGVTEDDVRASKQIVTDDALEEQLEEIRQEVNELDDRRDDLRGELRDVEDRIDTMEPFVSLGIDLDLLKGYDSLAVQVGEGDRAAVEDVLAASEVDTYEIFTGDGVVAVFAYTDESTLQDLLVEATFTGIEIPDGEGDPEEYLKELRHRKQRLESKLSTVGDELQDMRLEVGGFLLAAEEELTIDVQKREAPLTFATTDNAFIAEGWVPTERVGEVRQALLDAVGDHVEFSELERAEYDGDGHVAEREEVGHGGDEPGGQPAAADGGDDDVAADGGTVTVGRDEPPVIQDNPDPVRPFETLVQVINRPRYDEFDPTIIFFLTFPAFFGFMIGDLGYGLLYVLIGLAITRRFDSDAVRSLGGVAVWAGIFTVLFGVLYGEVFGLHILGEFVWGGNPPMHKGLQPAYSEYAKTWLVVSMLAGLVHLTIGYVLGFFEELHHGLKAAVLEKGSWILMLGGIWVFVFSTYADTVKPGFLFTIFAEGGIYPIGFSGFSPTVGLAGVAVFVVGLVLLTLGDIIEAVEFLNVLVNVLSYTRLGAVLLAKAGMAFVVNLLFFGVYVTGEGDHAAWHFGLTSMPEVGATAHGHEVTEIMFGGLLHSGIAGVVVGLAVLVLGHLLVLVLGITSAGLQGVRLEYVEFFSKFFQGGGKPYNPFGHEREHTSE
jgi:V/A-type H+-transporting ATPase subunit I